MPVGDGAAAETDKPRGYDIVARPLRAAEATTPHRSKTPAKYSVATPAYVSRYNIDWTYRSKTDYKFPSKYKVLKKLGKGSFSSVYLAEDVEFNRTIALKIVPKSKTRFVPQLPSMIEKELDILTRLPNHPQICQFYGYQDIPGMVAIELEFVAGKDLYKLVESKPLNESFARTIFRKTVEAVRVLEEASLYHVDIKPGNVMVDVTTGDVKVIDFGITMLSDEPVKATLEQPFAEIGSTEVALRDEYTPRSAIVWLLGSTLYQMMTGGHSPFRKFTMVPADESIHKKAYKIMPQITEEVLKLIEKKPQGIVMDKPYPLSSYAIARLDIINRRYFVDRYWSSELKDLFARIFVDEGARLSIEDVQNHAWLKL
jgi:serine/threonine protein kinase